MKNALYVSGMFAGGWIWDYAQPLIEADSHRVVPKALCQMSGRLDEILEEFNAELSRFTDPVTILSNSLGSYVAMKLAISQPELVERLIISGSAGFSEVKLPVKMNRKNPRPAARELVNMIYHDESRVPEEYAEMVVDCFADNFVSILRLMNESNKSVDSAQLLNQIRCPVHAIWGEQDVITPLSSARWSFDAYGVTTSVIPDCGHSPMCERWQDFAEEVNRISEVRFSKGRSAA